MRSTDILKITKARKPKPGDNSMTHVWEDSPEARPYTNIPSYSYKFTANLPIGNKPKPNKALADFLEAYPAQPTIPENSFTVEEYMKETGLCKPTVHTRLNALTKKGVLRKEVIRLGKVTKAFYTVVEDKKRGSR